jgi:hypothetical protein
MNSTPVAKVGLNRVKCRLPNGHDPLSSTFAEEPNRAIV